MGKKSKKNKNQAPYTASFGSMPTEILAKMLGMGMPQQKATMDEVAQAGKDVMPEHVSAMWRVQSEQACCDGSERDGIVLSVPSTKQFADKLTRDGVDPRRAHVVVVGVSEHSGDALTMNWDAEMLKKLHNILPQVIAAAEYQRDEALRMENANGL